VVDLWKSGEWEVLWKSVSHEGSRKLVWQEGMNPGGVERIHAVQLPVMKKSPWAGVEKEYVLYP